MSILCADPADVFLLACVCVAASKGMMQPHNRAHV